MDFKRHVSLDLDPVTAAVLFAHARSRRQTMEECISALLYRQAAVMSGWPGQAGAELERAALNELLPEPGRDEANDL